jgi:demethylmenaquinone methyltransferase/2-methoxy-6-polyprenyl-1,4-benzoquinol methylase
MKVENIKPYKESSEGKKKQVAQMFNNIARRYDFLNHFLSMGIDKIWRRKAISMLEKEFPMLILDIATGTADLAIESIRLNPEKIYGIDISTDMLEIGRNKIKKKNLQEKIQLFEGDSEDLIFEDNKFDIVTVAFGVRNFQNLRKGLGEMLRVLKPEGIVMILEFSQPTNPLLKKLYNFYSSHVTPKIGKAISKDGAAYTYLNESVSAFPFGSEFCKILTETGYKDVHARSLTFGVATIYTAKK